MSNHCLAPVQALASSETVVIPYLAMFRLWVFLASMLASACTECEEQEHFSALSIPPRPATPAALLQDDAFDPLV